MTFGGGRTWQTAPLPGLTPCAGSAEFLRASDPWLDFAPNGDIFHMSLVVDRALIDLLLGQADSGRSALLVHKSVNGGVTWTGPVAVVDEDFVGLHDKQSITADPHDSDFAYAAWDRFDFDANTGPALFVRTTDGGATWEPPTVLYDPGLDAQTLATQILVQPDGTLLAFFADTAFLEDGDTYELVVARSTDRGETWSAPTLIAPVQPSLNVAEPDTGDPIRGGEELFDVANDPANGALYAVWQCPRFSPTNHEAVALSISEDNGFTWSEPVRVNRTPDDVPPLQQQAFVPSVAVNSKGDVGVTYYDFRFNGPGNGASTDFWAVTCRPKPFSYCASPDAWSAEIRLTDQSFDLSTAPVAGGLFLGDYNGLAAWGDQFVSVFSVSSPNDPANALYHAFKHAPQGFAKGRQK